VPFFQFGTVGSLLSSPGKPGGTVSGIQSANLGLDCLEIGWVGSANVKESTCEKIHQHAQSHNIALRVHASYFINLNATDKEWENSRSNRFRFPPWKISSSIY